MAIAGFWRGALCLCSPLSPACYLHATATYMLRKRAPLLCGAEPNHSFVAAEALRCITPWSAAIHECFLHIRPSVLSCRA